MGSVRTFQKAFSGGEVTPEFWSRIDDTKFQTGLATCRNFIVRPQGDVQNRSGTKFVHAVKNSASAVRVIPFIYSVTQTAVIEMGAGYFRLHTQGAVVLAGSPAAYNAGTAYVVGSLCSYGGLNYYCIAPTTGNLPTNTTYWYAMPATGEFEMPNAYAAADLFDIHYVQSADVLTLVHPKYAPMELRRYGGTNWVFSKPTFASTMTPPGGVGATAYIPGGAGSFSATYHYVVTAVNALGLDESVASTDVSCTGNLYMPGNYNQVNWTANGSASYNVYRLQAGVYGFIGQTTGNTFTDNNIAANTGITPPVAQTLFSSTGNYPGAVAYFQQRRCFGGSVNAPQFIWMTKSGTESNMNYCIPIQSSDSIQFRVVAREADAIRHLVPLASLVLLSSSSEWKISAGNSDALTPTNVSALPQSYVGANNVPPVTIANNLIYCANRGGHVREMAYQWQANGYVTGDLCLRAPHLFDNLNIVDMAYAKAPVPIIWCISSGGKLLGLTYIPEQSIGGWHQHDTLGGTFESCCVVPEGNTDILYLVVNRTINGNQVRYIEALQPRLFDDPMDAFIVDCGATYSGSPASTISGLSWLEGQTVNVLGDGAVMPQCVVTGGAITLPQAVSVAQVGLPITADLQTLPVAFETMGAGQGRVKNVNRVFLRVFLSGGIFAGPSFSALTEYKQRGNEPYGSPPALVTDEIRIDITPSWGTDGQVSIRQTAPLPLTVTGMSLDVTVGG
jgi:hypothetical protein